MRNEWMIREERFLDGNRADHNINQGSVPAELQAGTSK
jgi:hypothetical protein